MWAVLSVMWAVLVFAKEFKNDPIKSGMICLFFGFAA